MKSILLVATLLIASAGVYADGSSCLMLGWSGGAAKSGAKWVKSTYTESGNQGSIKYDWKNGVMTGAYNAATHHFSGTWQQDGSAGGTFSFKVPKKPKEQVNGWWSSKGDSKKYGLAVRACN